MRSNTRAMIAAMTALASSSGYGTLWREPRFRRDRYPGQSAAYMRGAWRGDGIPCTMKVKDRKARRR
jgi:hypothetical protein